MALEGKIKEFGIADIVQLIAQQQKTGILLIEKKRRKSVVCFVNGQVTETRASHQMKRDPLGEMLVKAKLISTDDLKRALNKQKDTFEYLGEILLKDGLISQTDLERAILTQVHETFYDLLQWRDGRYRFVPEKLSIDPNLSAIPSVESILLDVFRMIDEWPDVQKFISSFDMVFEKNEEKRQEISDSDRLRVFGLIDRTKTVLEIIDETLLGRFGACMILSELLQKGYIKLVANKAKRRRSKKSISLQKAIGVISYFALFITFYALSLMPTRFPENILPILNPKDLNSSYIQQYYQYRIIQKLKKAVEIFYLQNGQYPDSLGQFMGSRILNDADDSIIYSKEEDTYTIKRIHPPSNSVEQPGN